MNTFPVFKFQIDKYMILDTDKANQLLFVHLIAHVSVQNYANSQLNLIRSICNIILVALNINSVQFYQKKKKIFNCLLRQHFLQFASIKYIIIMQVLISSKTIPPGQTTGHYLKGAKILLSGQSLCTKTIPTGQNRESKVTPPRHKVRKFYKNICKL